MPSNISGTDHGQTVEFANDWDPRNPFSTEGVTVRLLHIMVKLVENLFPAVFFLTTIVLCLLQICCSLFEGYFLKKFLQGKFQARGENTCLDRAFKQNDDNAMCGVQFQYLQYGCLSPVQHQSSSVENAIFRDVYLIIFLIKFVYFTMYYFLLTV